jgi:hypothetical protein
MTQKIIFSNYFDMVSKNAEFDADFESVEKVLKNSNEKSYLHESVGIMFFFTFQYCVQKFSAL